MSGDQTTQLTRVASRRSASRARGGWRRQAPVRRRDVTGPWAVALRLGIALAVALAVAGFLWLHRPHQLEQPDDIVGYPSFFHYNFAPVFLAHRILMWELPGLTALGYWLLTRFGPLRSTSRPAPRHELEPVPAAPAAAAEPPSSALRVARLLPAGAVLWLGVSARGDGPDQRLSLTGLVVSIAYVVLVFVAGVQWARRGGGDRAPAVLGALATPVAAAVGLWVFVHETGTVDTSGRFRQWSWLPWWFAVLAVLAVWTVVLVRLRRATAAPIVERGTTSTVAGSVLVFLLATRIPGTVPRIQGFDDMHAVVGADLFTRGYFPWRDVLFMHGVFEDALRANVGFALFEHSVWGAGAAALVVWTPLLFIGYYLLAVWVSPRQWVLHLAVVLATAWGSTVLPASVRWFAVGYVLVLFGEVLRRGRRLPTALFTVLLFAAAVLIPEMSFLVMAVAVVFVAHDLAHPDRRELVWWRRLLRTRDFVVTGAALTVAWSLFLAAFGALRDWITYYLYFGPGHSASGTLPLDLVDNGFWKPVFFVSEAVTLVALVWILVRLFTGRPLDHRYGVLLVAALTTGLYAEKGLGRFDVGHIGQVLSVAVCLWLVMIGIAADWVADRLPSVLARRRDRAGRVDEQAAPASTGRPPLIGVLGARHGVAVVALGLAALVPQAGLTPRIDRLLDGAPGHSRVGVPSQTGNPDLVGYSDADGTDMQMVSDLAKLLGTLSPPGETVYDFTNNPGYFTYLLQEELPTRVYTVGLALPEISQDELLDELQDAQPAVVVYDDLFYGLPAWDGPRNEIRHYVVSPYLLDGWTPVVSTYGFLIMVRNDLVPDLPTLPQLHNPLLTEDLYFSMPRCGWGYIPDYLHAEPTGDETTLPVGAYAKVRRINAAGWAYDAVGNRPAEEVLVAVGHQVVASTEPELSRPDVAQGLGQPGATVSGFSVSTTVDHGGRVGVYAVVDGAAHRLGGPGKPNRAHRIRMADGTSLPVSDTPAGSVDNLDSASRWTAPVTVPPGVDLADYGMATFVADGPIKKAAVTLFDGGSGGISREIGFQTDRTSDSVGVRVGACLQWHGYSGDQLYLTQQGGNRISEIRLSQVEDD